MIEIRHQFENKDWFIPDWELKVLIPQYAGLDGAARSAAIRMAVPSPDHFLPILYSAGLLEGDESVEFFNDRPVAGSLTMTGVRGVF